MIIATEISMVASAPSRAHPDFAVIRSLISTARKQGWDLLQTLTAEPAHLIASLRFA